MGLLGPDEPDAWDAALALAVFAAVLCGVLSFVQLVSN